MTRSKSQVVSFQKLDMIFSDQLKYLKSLEELGLLAEIVSATTCSEKIGMEILRKMECLLEISQSPQEYFDHSDHAANLSLAGFEERMIIRGLELVVKGGGSVSEYPEQLGRLEELNPRNASAKRLIGQSIERRIKSLKSHGEEIVRGVNGESWVRDVIGLLATMDRCWNDPAYSLQKLVDLIQVSDIDSSDRAEVEEMLIGSLSAILESNEVLGFNTACEHIKRVEVHLDEYQQEFDEILSIFKLRIEERGRLK